MFRLRRVVRLGFWREHWDGAVAVALVGLAFVPGIARQGIDIGELHHRPTDAFALALVVLQGAPVLLLRRWPRACLALIGLAFGSHQLLAYPTTIASLGLLVALAGAGALVEQHRRIVAAVAAGFYILVACGLSAEGSPSTLVDFIAFGLVLTLLWIAGLALRARTRAEVERRSIAERETVASERSRIAREMHDIVTHHVTAIVVQADAAQYTPDVPAETRTTLETISDAGRTALAELRFLLGALDGSADSSREPVVTSVNDVIDRARAAGHPVDFQPEGTPRPLVGAAGLAVSRVVQEGLTNVMKHAPGAPTVVVIRYGPGHVEVEVNNASRVRTASDRRRSLGRGSGRGLIGLRERVTVVGGTLEAGARDGGFTVRARVPHE